MDKSDSIDLVDRTESSAYFDEAIGHIQDIILSAEFEVLHQQFLEQHWRTFDYAEENKIEYMTIYESYQMLFENYLTEQLSERMRHFSMERFDVELSKQRRCYKVAEDDEILELIDTITDFQKFKVEMLDYRGQKEGRLAFIESGNILVTRSYNCGNAG